MDVQWNAVNANQAVLADDCIVYYALQRKARIHQQRLEVCLPFLPACKHAHRSVSSVQSTSHLQLNFVQKHVAVLQHISG